MIIYDLVKVIVSWKFENMLKSEQVLAAVSVIGWKQDPSMTAGPGKVDGYTFRGINSVIFNFWFPY